MDVDVGGQVVNMTRYEDDKAVVCSSQKILQQLMGNLKS